MAINASQADIKPEECKRRLFKQKQYSRTQLQQRQFKKERMSKSMRLLTCRVSTRRQQNLAEQRQALSKTKAIRLTLKHRITFEYFRLAAE